MLKIMYTCSCVIPCCNYECEKHLVLCVRVCMFSQGGHSPGKLGKVGEFDTGREKFGNCGLQLTCTRWAANSASKMGRPSAYLWWLNKIILMPLEKLGNLTRAGEWSPCSE